MKKKQSAKDEIRKAHRNRPLCSVSHPTSGSNPLLFGTHGCEIWHVPCFSIGNK